MLVARTVVGLLVLATAGACSTDETTACDYFGTSHADGEVFPAGDGCNSCACNPTGQTPGEWGCSLLACPPLDECFGGDFFADCGGGGAPVLACNADTLDCRWFTGVVAGSYTASSCPASDVCCVDDWPFAREATTAQAVLFHELTAHGLEPWDRTRAMTLAVVVDPLLAPVTSSCSGVVPDEGTGVCAGGVVTTSSPGLLVAHVMPESALWGWGLLVEADLAATPPVARACRTSFTDYIDPWCGRLESADGVDCALSGSLTVTSLATAELHGRLDASFASGLVWSGSL